MIPIDYIRIMLNQKSRFLLSFFLITLIFATACERISSEDRIQEIEKLEEEVNTERKASFGVPQNPEKIRQLADEYEAFAKAYPEATQTPDFLWKAAELYSQDLGEIQHGIELFEQIYQEYPKSEHAAKALFLTGFLYNNELHDLIKAEKAYTLFLEKYPEHELAKDARLELQYLNLSSEELMQMLEPADSLQQDTIIP